MVPLTPTACGVCGHVLNLYSDAFGERWVHALPSDEDHPPVPVYADSIHTTFMCDFCLAEGASWALPVEDYADSSTAASSGDWAACDACAALLRVNDWDKLITRTVAASRNRGNSYSRQDYELLYQKLRQHVIGKVRRVDSR